MKKVGIVSVMILIVITSPLVLSCTVFHASNDTCAYGGNNEDYSISDTYIYFYPPTASTYGKVIVGYSGNYRIQGGVNEKGLFWDGLATPYLEVKDSADKPYFNGHLIDYIMDSCESCDEALTVLDQYNLKILENAQILIGDQYGNSIIVEGDIIHFKSNYYQVATNFYLSQHPDPPYPSGRYNTALEMFDNHPVEDLSVEFCASVLDAVHQEGAYPTQYSTVYDLKNNLIYLYHFHNYDKVKIFNLSEEFELGYHSYSIPDLFRDDLQPPNKPLKPNGPSQAEIGKEYYYITSTTDPNDDPIYYLFDWGDGTDSDWQGPYGSGEQCNLSHSWSIKGSYEIKVKAKDMYGNESPWSDPLIVSMSKQRVFTSNIFHNLRFIPLLYELLNLFI
jgi:predicted choloylglycine hydrolase